MTVAHFGAALISESVCRNRWSYHTADIYIPASAHRCALGRPVHLCAAPIVGDGKQIHRLRHTEAFSKSPETLVKVA